MYDCNMKDAFLKASTDMKNAKNKEERDLIFNAVYTKANKLINDIFRKTNIVYKSKV